MESSPVGIGIIGFGFMGRTHAAGYLAAGSRAQILGVVGRREIALGAPGPREDDWGAWENDVTWFENADALLAREDIQAVSICSYTDSHVPIALKALARGKHVLVEKPVSLSSDAVAVVASAARESGLVCMPAMCMRFWPGWPWLRELVRGGTEGVVKRAEFVRTGARPGWGADFYLDEHRSGGALFDLHIHDVDFIRWCFGDPATVSSSGTTHDVTTRYAYPDSPALVSARGAWLPDPLAPFSMRYEVEFSGAVVRFDLDSSPAVRIIRGNAIHVVTLPEEGAYDGEIRHFLDLVGGRTEHAVAPIDDAVAVIRILESEALSLETGRAVALGLSGR